MFAVRRGKACSTNGNALTWPICWGSNSPRQMNSCNNEAQRAAIANTCAIAEPCCSESYGAAKTSSTRTITEAPGLLFWPQKGDGRSGIVPPEVLYIPLQTKSSPAALHYVSWQIKQSSNRCIEGASPTLRWSAHNVWQACLYSTAGGRQLHRR